MMKRLIVTGPNGAGKSYLAAQLGAARPGVPVISFDAMKLTENWKQRSRSQIDAELSAVIQQDIWILEGGPSMLPFALKRADGIMWLDPSMWVRAWRLAIRPLHNIGRTRLELPPGNVDWPWQQYRFAIRSLRNHSQVRDSISRQLAVADSLRTWHIKDARDLASAIDDWRNMSS